MNYGYYINKTLETNLFFLRIMKEHAFFLEASFLEKDKKYKEVARNFQVTYENYLRKFVELSEGRLTTSFIESEIIVTKDTLKAEEKTSSILGISLDKEITTKTMFLNENPVKDKKDITPTLESLNKEILFLTRNFIEFKEDTLKNILECKITTNMYPLMINHLINEAKLFHDTLLKIQNKEILDEKFIYKKEKFWNDGLIEHTKFIQNMLDPTEKEERQNMHYFENELESIQNKNTTQEYSKLLKEESIKLSNYHSLELDKILNCKLLGTLSPLFLDHLKRETNNLTRITKEKL